MGQYENLVKALRHCGDHLGCTECPRYDAEKARKYFGCGALEDAAAAIEELQARLGEAENSVERWKDMYLTKHEPKLGEWVCVEDGESYHYECSECGERPLYSRFGDIVLSGVCPMCGADMRKMEVQDADT